MREIVWDSSEGQAHIQALRWIHPKEITFRELLTHRILTDD